MTNKELVYFQFQIELAPTLQPSDSTEQVVLSSSDCDLMKRDETSEFTSFVLFTFADDAEAQRAAGPQD